MQPFAGHFFCHPFKNTESVSRISGRTSPLADPPRFGRRSQNRCKPQLTPLSHVADGCHEKKGAGKPDRIERRRRIDWRHAGSSHTGIRSATMPTNGAGTFRTHSASKQVDTVIIKRVSIGVAWCPSFCFAPATSTGQPTMRHLTSHSLRYDKINLPIFRIQSTPTCGSGMGR